MKKEDMFAMCRRAQIKWNEEHDEKAYKRWKILEGRIIDAGELEEYEAWYKENQDRIVKEWNKNQEVICSGKR